MLAGALYFGPTHTELAISHCEEVLAAAAGHGGVEGAVACYLAGLLAMAGRFQEARDYSSRGTKLLDELGPSVAGGARAAVADAELLTGDARAAEQELTTAYEAATRIGDRMIALSSVYELAAVLCTQDRYEEAEQWAARGRDVVDRVDVMTRVVAFAAEARLATHSGRLDAARGFARRAVELSDRTDASNYRASAWLAAAEVASFDERESDARDAVERALALYAEKGNVAAAAQVTASGRRSSVASSALRRGSGGT
jgi:tetratricopeptide (TPR) repeat protein